MSGELLSPDQVVVYIYIYIVVGWPAGQLAVTSAAGREQRSFCMPPHSHPSSRVLEQCGGRRICMHTMHLACVACALCAP